MVEFAHKYVGGLKDEVLEEMTRGGFGIFVGAWYIHTFCNIEYTSKSYLVEMVKKLMGVGFR